MRKLCYAKSQVGEKPSDRRAWLRGWPARSEGRGYPARRRGWVPLGPALIGLALQECERSMQLAVDGAIKECWMIASVS